MVIRIETTTTSWTHQIDRLPSGSPHYDYDPLLYAENWASAHMDSSLFNLLQQNGVASKLPSLPDEGHVVENQVNRLVR